MVLMTLRIKKVYIARAILITFLLVISFLSLKLYSSTLGNYLKKNIHIYLI